MARVEQTETPQMMEKRVKKSEWLSQGVWFLLFPSPAVATPTKHDRVVRREVCNIVTKGTRTLSFSDGVESDVDAAFLLAVKEKVATPT